MWVRSQPDSAYRAVAALCVYDYFGLPVYGGYGCYRGEERGIKNKKSKSDILAHGIKLMSESIRLRLFYVENSGFQIIKDNMEC